MNDDMLTINLSVADIHMILSTLRFESDVLTAACEGRMSDETPRTRQRIDNLEALRQSIEVRIVCMHLGVDA
jgi:hypothetical protein